MGTDVSSKGPFAKPDLVFDFVRSGSVTIVVIAELSSGIHAMVPGLIIVVVHSDKINIVIFKKIIP